MTTRETDVVTVKVLSFTEHDPRGGGTYELEATSKVTGAVYQIFTGSERFAEGLWSGSTFEATITRGPVVEGQSTGRLFIKKLVEIPK